MDSLRKTVSPRERAVALIIVLAFVVLLTGLVVAYLSRATSDRQVAHSSFNQSKADQLAQSAMDNVIGDLRQEILNGSGSPSPTASPVSLFVPTSNANLLPMVSPTPTPGTTPAIPNLIRRSARSDPLAPLMWPDPNAGPALGSRASAVNSTNPADISANGRSISLARWNSHYLVPKLNPGDDKSDPITTGFTAPNYWAPDWVFVTNNGATVITQPNNSVIGRYAYAIYDEGGLLDMNVAGYPSTATPAQYGPKGTSAFADLTVLGMSSSGINSLVGWRNYASAQPTGTFPTFTFSTTAATNYVNNFALANTNGFTAVGTSPSNNQTDQAFVTRQQLIQLRTSIGSAAFPATALQYLTTFSRELNATSWTPTLNATDMGALNNGVGNIYAYKDNAANPAATPINRNLLNVRVINLFIRADGTTAAVGDALINRRFPLTRLAGVGPTGVVTTGNSTIVNGAPTVASGTTIQRDFGLQWDSANNRWDYVGPTGSTVQATVERLDQVAAENPGREPNFFELLKAGTLSGSVGLGSGNTNTFVTAETKYYSTPLSSDYQIMQIGANIIDQWDADKNPTSIYFAGNEFAGVENLPYLSKLVFQPLWTTGGGAKFKAWIVPSLWMPAQNGTQIGASGSTIPAVRFIMTSGSISAKVYAGATSAPSLVVAADPTNSSTQPYVQLTSTRAFGPNPNFQQYSNASTPPRQLMTGVPSNASGNALGIETVFSSTPGITSTNTTKAAPVFSNAVFEMQAQIGGSSGPWKTYQRWFGSTSSAPACEPAAGFDWTQTNIYDPEFVLLDPRTMRFGVWESDAKTTGTTDFTRGLLDTLDRSSPLFFQGISSMGPQGSHFSGVGAQMANNPATAPNYTDLDGVRRDGDVISSGSTSAMLPTDSADRPLILSGAFQNGVFQSVAELGHVFRDQPWKTLNFTTGNSADAGLLDVFTLHESSMEAGKTSLNTKQTPVLTAILSKAATTLTGTNMLTPSQVSGVVTALAALTAANPMLNKAELVTRLAADASVTGLGNKEARECVMRAFSDACQTRTWNLMIDVIAQSGRYPPTVTANPQPADLPKFIVEGEQRYWVHVAIDRFTGQVIDKQIEVVNE